MIIIIIIYLHISNIYYIFAPKTRIGSLMNDEKRFAVGGSSVHPGKILQSVLEDYDMSQKELAVAIGKPSPIVNDIIKGKRNINPEFAFTLDKIKADSASSLW